MLIATDFDGTIVEHRYPAIGKELPFAVATLKKLQAEGHRIILWSVREGRLLDEAVQWCREHGIELYAANSNFPEELPQEGRISSTACRKLKADIFIDDRNLGGLPDWGAIYEMIHGGYSYEQYLSCLHNAQPAKKQSALRRFFCQKKGER